MKKIIFFIFAILFCINSYALPAGYTQLEYLQTNDGAYIDTGIKLNASSKFDFKFVPGTWYNYAVFGADNGAYYNNGEIGLFYYWSSGYGDVIEAVLPYSNTSSSVLDPRPSMQQNMVYTVSYDKDYLVVNGASQSSGWYADYVGNRNAFLFATNRGDTTWAGGDTKIYYFKMYNGNNLVRDFIPAKRNSDGVLGMYDTVSNTFFTNAGSGNFIAGYGIASTSYVQGMYEAINNSKMAKLNPDSIEFTPDSTPYGFFTAVEGAGDKFRFKREEITLPVGSYDNPTGRMSIWLE